MGAGGFGIVPEVDGVGEEWVVLDSVPDEADEDGGARDAGAGSWVTLAGATVGWELVAVALARVNLAVASPPVTVYLWIKVCKPLSSMVRGSILVL